MKEVWGGGEEWVGGGGGGGGGLCFNQHPAIFGRWFHRSAG
jgi:hypothetical protein